jgi:hypothetical protein
MYAVITKNYSIEIYENGRLKTVIKAYRTYEQAYNFCQYEGLEIKPYAR